MRAAEQRVQNLLVKGQQTSDRAREMVQTSQETMATFQKRVDDRVRAAVEQMTTVSDARKQLDDISRRIEALEQRLDELTKK